MSEGLFYEVMDKKSDAELIDIITHQRDSYRPEAIQEAEEALKRRDFTDAELNALIEKSEVEQKEIENQKKPKTRGPFSGPGTIVTLLIIIPLMLVVKQRGMLETFLIAALGFGAGRLVNHMYFNYKDNQSKDDLLDN